MKELLLAFCTILGGISAIWFFGGRIFAFIQNIDLTRNKRIENSNCLLMADDEFTLVSKLINLPNLKEYLPTSSSEKNTFNKLVNHGYLKLSKHHSYLPTKKFKKKVLNLK